MQERRRYFDVSRTESLGAGLKRYLKESGVGWMLRHADVVAYWQEVVGPTVGAQTRVRGLRSGTLHVDIYSRALKAEIEQFQADSLVRVFQDEHPGLGIRRVRFHLAEAPTDSVEEG